MQLHGLMKLTLLDYPGKTACTVFTGGCNFRCPFCHNAELVQGAGELIEEADFFSFLEKRTGILDGVAVTGGEPLMQSDIAAFLEKVRAMGFSIKLDTNGSYPERLRTLVQNGLVDYVAMDIKASKEGYPRAAGGPVPLDKICESVDFLLSGAVDYEFRTTAARGLVLPEDFPGIGRWIQGAKRYFIQNFVDSGHLLGICAGAYEKEELEQFLAVIRPFVPNAALRGI